MGSSTASKTGLRHSVGYDLSCTVQYRDNLSKVNNCEQPEA